MTWVMTGASRGRFRQAWSEAAADAPVGAPVEVGVDGHQPVGVGDAPAQGGGVGVGGGCDGHRAMRV